MAMRLSGINSGLDTEGIIKELVAVRQTKVDNVKKEQKKLEWKQEIWRELNSKITKLFNGTLSNLRFYSSYSKKTTKSSNSNVATIQTSDTAMNSTQSLKVTQLAKAGYLTGQAVTGQGGATVTTSSNVTEALGIQAGSTFEVSAGGKTKAITISGSTTIADVVAQMKEAGISANFDAKNQRFFLSASGTGVDKDFSVTASNSAGTDALTKMGILTYDKNSLAAYEKYAEMASDAGLKQAAMDAEIASRVATYQTQRTSLKTTLEGYEQTREQQIEAYSTQFGEDIATADKADIQAQVDALEANDARTEEETQQLEKLKAKIVSIEAYEANNASITQAENTLTDIAKYVDADGEATALLKSEIQTAFDEKIAHAQATLAGGLTGLSGAYRIEGQDAIIELNNAVFTGDSNTFEINGLTITALQETGADAVTLTTENDNSGTYDMIVGFIKEYNSIINEMDKLYNADSASKYAPLTDDEKDAMTEKEIEVWETKIKDSLLRRDGSLNTVSSAMKSIMSAGYTINGKTLYLSNFGIETMGYFEAADNEKNAYHINGDKDDAKYSNKSNDLLAMISSDPETVTEFFVQISKAMDTKLNSIMTRSEYRSSYTVYDDKRMKAEYTDYTNKIADLEAKLLAYEDKWYSKFAAMETALAKMQSNSNAVTSLLGG